MAYARKGEGSKLILVLLVLSGIVIGGFLGSLASGTSFLKWLDFGYGFGQETPLVLDLHIMRLTLQVYFNITIASIIGILLAVFLYRKL